MRRNGLRTRAQSMAANNRDGKICKFPYIPLTFLIDRRPTVQFMVRLTTSMILDFGGCWLTEIVCKALFADLTPKEFVTRGRTRREMRRAAEELGKEEEKKTQ